jgi:hypothetical protein
MPMVWLGALHPLAFSLSIWSRKMGLHCSSKWMTFLSIMLNGEWWLVTINHWRLTVECWMLNGECQMKQNRIWLKSEHIEEQDIYFRLMKEYRCTYGRRRIMISKLEFRFRKHFVSPILPLCHYPILAWCHDVIMIRVWIWIWNSTLLNDIDWIHSSSCECFKVSRTRQGNSIMAW